MTNRDSHDAACRDYRVLEIATSYVAICRDFGHKWRDFGIKVALKLLVNVAIRR